MWYNKLIVAKQAKAARVNRNKARLVKRTIIRLWGKTAGQSWFRTSRWHRYIDDDVYADMPALEPIVRAVAPQAPAENYADVLRKDMAISMEAVRRRERGTHFEYSVRQYVDHILKYSSNEQYLDAMTEAIARVRRNDPEFEEAVRCVSDKWYLTP